MKIVIEPAKRAAAEPSALSPISWARKIGCRDPGACAPGFMLTPASQAKQDHFALFTPVARLPLPSPGVFPQRGLSAAVACEQSDRNDPPG
jgi:hypothetical protein